MTPRRAYWITGIAIGLTALSFYVAFQVVATLFGASDREMVRNQWKAKRTAECANFPENKERENLYRGNFRELCMRYGPEYASKMMENIKRNPPTRTICGDLPPAIRRELACS